MAPRIGESALLRFGLENYSLTGAAVHHDADRFRKLQVADTALFSHGRLFRQPLPIDRAFARVGIHGEVTDPKGSEILEEMAALRWGDAKIVESRLNNHARAGDFIPFDRNAQPGLVRSPASNPDQQIGSVLRIELAIELSNRLGHFLAA